MRTCPLTCLTEFHTMSRMPCITAVKGIHQCLNRPKRTVLNQKIRNPNKTSTLGLIVMLMLYMTSKTLSAFSTFRPMKNTIFRWPLDDLTIVEVTFCHHMCKV